MEEEEEGEEERVAREECIRVFDGGGGWTREKLNRRDTEGKFFRALSYRSHGITGSLLFPSPFSGRLPCRAWTVPPSEGIDRTTAARKTHVAILFTNVFSSLAVHASFSRSKYLPRLRYKRYGEYLPPSGSPGFYL